MAINIDYGTGIISIDNVSDEVDKWIIKQAETIDASRAEVIVKSFESDFPQIKLLGNDDNDKYEYLTKLVSRSEKLGLWFAVEKVKFSELAQLPSYLTDHVKPENFKEIRDKISSVNKLISKFALDKKNLTNQYKEDLRSKDELLAKEINKEIGDDKIVKILTLTSQSLPLSIIDSIESYNPQTTDNNFDEKKKLYGRELLTKFKVELIKIVNNNPNVDIDELIDKISLK